VAIYAHLRTVESIGGADRVCIACWEGPEQLYYGEFTVQASSRQKPRRHCCYVIARSAMMAERLLRAKMDAHPGATKWLGIEPQDLSDPEARIVGWGVRR